MKIRIYNYGASNLYSIFSAIKKLNDDTKVVEELEESENLNILVLPGVGNFSQASKSIKKSREKILNLAERGTLVLGICLGLHMFYEESEEGEGEGLGALKGKVTKIKKGKVPHMGWSYTKFVKENVFFPKDIEGEWFYYAHSYQVPYDERLVYAFAENGGNKIPAVVIDGNFFGLQFHPEKSGKAGRKVLENVFTVIKR